MALQTELSHRLSQESGIGGTMYVVTEDTALFLHVIIVYPLMFEGEGTLKLRMTVVTRLIGRGEGENFARLPQYLMAIHAFDHLLLYRVMGRGGELLLYLRMTPQAQIVAGFYQKAFRFRLMHTVTGRTAYPVSKMDVKIAQFLRMGAEVTLGAEGEIFKDADLIRIDNGARTRLLEMFFPIGMTITTI